MKIYFEKFGKGSIDPYLTPNKPYEADELSTGVLRIDDDEGFRILIRLNTINPMTKSEWKVWTHMNRDENDLVSMTRGAWEGHKKYVEALEQEMEALKGLLKQLMQADAQARCNSTR